MSEIRKISADSEKKGVGTFAIDNGADIVDNGDRRLGYERRQFGYSHCFPDRRAGRDRRTLPEKRIDVKLSS